MPDKRVGLRTQAEGRWLAALAVSLILSSPGAPAQEWGTVRGRVVDAQGRPLAGAVISLRSASRPGAAGLGAVSGPRGEYRIPYVPPAADYEASCSLEGYATLILRPLRVSAGAAAVANFSLIDSLVETIRVEAVGSLVDMETTATSIAVGGEFLAGLPILGRSYSDALTLAPGVTDIDGDGVPNVKGAREVDFQFRISGVPVNDPFSGGRGLEFNIEAIEEMQILTGAFGAEHTGQGGIGLVTTRSGGNEFEGTFKLFYQTRSLDGDGAANNDFTTSKVDPPSFRTLRPFLTAGGAFRRNRLWYYTALEHIDVQTPIRFGFGAANSSAEGQRDFGKLSWQVSPEHKASLELYYEPTDTAGNNIGPTIAEESDALIDTRGRLFTLRETAVFSPVLLLESTLSYFGLDRELHPVFEPDLSIEDDIQLYENGSRADPLMLEFVLRNGFSVFPYNQHYLFDTRESTVRGPYWVSQHQDSQQITLREDLSYYVDDWWGSHTLKAGIEAQSQDYHERARLRPTVGYTEQRGAGASVNFIAPVPSSSAGLDSERTQVGLYVQDTWKPLSNLTFTLGVRVDWEGVRSSGRGLFDPAAEVEEYNRLARLYYADPSPAGGEPGAEGQIVLGERLDFDINPETDTFFCDLDGDGTCNGYFSAVGTSHPGVGLNSDQVVLRDVFSRHNQDCSRIREWNAEPGMSAGSGRVCLGTGDPYRVREGRDLVSERISIRNTNLAPRLSLAFDPFADGKTKLYANYGRFYGYLFLETVASEGHSGFQSFSFNVPDADFPGVEAPSDGGFSIYQVGRDLRTPFTDEFVVGLERELAPEVAIKVVYTSRKGREQLQDIDLNHVAVDRLPADESGPDGILDDCRNKTEDEPLLGSCGPDGFPDIEVLNPNFDQIFRIGNFNASSYRSLELVLSRRLHRNWQFEASYTWSEARGNAEEYLSFLGDDPSQADPEAGFLDYDQRHVFKLNAVAHLPGELMLGGTIQYASGLPFSIVRRALDEDNLGNALFRTIYPSGQRNDQRNSAAWTFNASVKKSLAFGRVKAIASLEVFDLLDSDDLHISSLNRGASSGLQISDPFDPATREFGRRFQVGVELHF